MSRARSDADADADGASPSGAIDASRSRAAATTRLRSSPPWRPAGAPHRPAGGRHERAGPRQPGDAQPPGRAAPARPARRGGGRRLLGRRGRLGRRGLGRRGGHRLDRRVGQPAQVDVAAAGGVVGRGDRRRVGGRAARRGVERKPSVAREPDLDPGVGVAVGDHPEARARVVAAAGVADGHPRRDPEAAQHHRHGAREVLAVAAVAAEQEVHQGRPARWGMPAGQSSGRLVGYGGCSS